jgi:iron(II)-dependent oxidoreductase
MSEAAETIAREMGETRAETLALFDAAREEDLHLSPGFGFRPVLWHLAHIGVFESYWLLQKLRGLPSPDERYERVFDPIATPREESRDLPARAEMEEYLARVRSAALDSLASADFDSTDPMLTGGYVFQLVLEHERQHQETLAYLLHLLDPSKKRRPGVARDVDESDAHVDESVAHKNDADSNVGRMVEVAGGEFVMGAVWDAFAYDNELPPREVAVAAFRIDRLLTTNEEFAEFVKEGGYLRREWWGDEGWAAREKEGWECPLYWTRCDEGWRARRMFDEGALDPRHPVVGVSWHEAEAYARFRGKRLPTEAEWEWAASWDAASGRRRRYAWGDEEPDARRCNFGGRRWGTTEVGAFPAGASPAGCLDMTGNVWEWTADAFEGFPGFRPFPYPEYSEVWFDGDHRVLKGGSWATRAPVLRTSFRNFFRRHFRIAFAGIRLAEDA